MEVKGQRTIDRVYRRAEELKATFRGRADAESGQSAYHFGIYNAKKGIGSVYGIFFGIKRDFEYTVKFPYFFEEERARVVALKRIPFEWQEEIAAYCIAQKKAGFGSVAVGHIEYHIDKGVRASAVWYYPREWLKTGVTGGIPYLFETVTVSHLKDTGITSISTGDAPSKRRIRQLAAVGLPHCEAIHVDEWLKGLGRGIRRSTLAKKS